MKKVSNTNRTKVEVSLLPVILAIGVVPLIVHTYFYDTGLSQFDWFPAESESQTDFFMGWKMIAIIILGASMVLMLLYRFFRKKRIPEINGIWYLLLFYALFVGMSALFSPYKRWVSKGTYELLEPVWAVLSYIILCFYTCQIVQNEEQAEKIVHWSFIGIALVLLIGLLQFSGMDPFRMKAFKMLITPPSAWDRLDGINILVPERTCYMTLYNQDYAAFYVGLILPVTVAFLISGKKWWKNLAWGVAVAAELVCLYGSHASSGWMAAVIAFAIVGIILLSRNRKALIAGLIVLAIGLATCTGILFATDAGIVLRSEIFGSYKQNEQYLVSGIDTGESEIVFDCKGNLLHISYEISADQGICDISVRDDNGIELPCTQDSENPSSAIFSDSRFGSFTVSLLDQGDNRPIALNVSIDGCSWQFVKLDDGYYYINSAGKCVKFPDSRICEVFNEDALNGRGHIWNRTIPLLGKHIFIGSGANTFMLEYPQDDYLYKVYSETSGFYDVKAHNWYLQQGVENGMIALLLLLAFYLCYFVQSVRIYRRVNLKKRINLLGLGLFAGTLVYMVTAFANDPTVNVASMYWAFLGLGIAVNRLIIKSENLSVKSSDTATGQTENFQPSEQHTANIPEEPVPKHTGKKKSRKERKKH